MKPVILNWLNRPRPRLRINIQLSLTLNIVKLNKLILNFSLVLI